MLPSGPVAVTLAPLPWWRRHTWAASALILGRVLLITAGVSVDIVLEQLAGLSSNPVPTPGLYTVEHAVDPEFFVQRMKEEGVVFHDT